MATTPIVNRGDWIHIGGKDCVVSVVRAAGHRLGDCEIVCDPDKPLSSNVRWDGDKWVFIGRGPYEGQVMKYLRFKAVIEKLRRGRDAE